MVKSDIIAVVVAQLRELIERCRESESRYAAELLAVHPEYRDSAYNLVHYLALRGSDIQELQETLAILGLSSLDRAERNVMASLHVVQTALQSMTGETAELDDFEPEALGLRTRGSEHP